MIGSLHILVDFADIASNPDEFFCFYELMALITLSGVLVGSKHSCLDIIVELGERFVYCCFLF